MIDIPDNLTPQQQRKLQRELLAVKKRLDGMHELRNKINKILARINVDNLEQALSQKKNLKLLSRQYDQLVIDLNCLPIVEAARILEEEYNYILTIGNILETTSELKKNTPIGAENRAALIDGLVKFYDGLRLEIAMQQ